MSEFQCYKFKTIDRPLSSAERNAVDVLSSRGKVSSTSATFIYHYSDFRHEPMNVLEKYFDVFLYFSNWGTKQLMFRLPSKLVNAEMLWKYCLEDEWSSSYIKVRRRGGFYILDLNFSEEEGGGWMEEDDYDIDTLGRIRDDILEGDYRALYLLWAKFSAANEEADIDEDDFEDEYDEMIEFEEEIETTNSPPVPPNLGKLTAALKTFIDFFEIEEDLVTAAQSASVVSAAPVFDYEKLLLQLPDKEKVEWLGRLLKGEHRLELLLKKRLEKLVELPPSPAAQTISPSQLRKQKEVAQTQRHVREAEAAKAAHLAKMQKLAANKTSHWKSVSYNIERKTGKSYDLATETLKELKQLAEHENDLTAFQHKMIELKIKYARYWALTKRWEAAGL